jgi:hypothetical protein
MKDIGMTMAGGHRRRRHHATAARSNASEFGIVLM